MTISPLISVLCVSNKCYYYKQVEDFYLHEFINKSDWLKLAAAQFGVELDEVFSLVDSTFTNKNLENLNREQLAYTIKAMISLESHKNDFDKYSLNYNGLEYEKIKFKTHKWIKVDVDYSNVEMLSFLSGISNTLSSENFGEYLLNGNEKTKICAVCYEDMWGNVSYEDIDFNGLNYNTNCFSFTFFSNEKENKYEIVFKRCN